MNMFESTLIRIFRNIIDEPYCINTRKALFFVRKSNDESVLIYVNNNF